MSAACRPWRGMRRVVGGAAICALLIAAPARPLVRADSGTPTLSAHEPRNPTDQTRIRLAYRALAMRFEPSAVGARDRASYTARGAGYSVVVGPTEARLRLSRAHEQLKRDNGPVLGRPRDEAVFGMRLLGADRNATAAVSNELSGTVNYFIGNDPSEWRTNVRTFGRVEYRDVYPGINIVYYGTQSHLEHDFVLGPGADYRKIAFTFDGAERLDIDQRGDLTITVDRFTLVQRAPVVYQDIDGRRRHVDARYVRRGNGRVGFQVGPHDRSRSLVIDPVLSLSTYVGGLGGEGAAGIALDGSGNVYITGYAGTVGDGPISIFVAKLSGDGRSLTYWTTFGGTQSYPAYPQDHSTGIAVGGEGDAYVTGVTNTTNFPVSDGALQGSLQGSSDAFVTKLDSSGRIVYSTYLGGKDSEVGFGIGVDTVGSAYVTGFTMSSDFPIANAFQPTFGGSPAYARSDGSGGGSNWAPIESGLNTRWVLSIAADPANPGTLYAGTYGDGAFKSVNNGADWTPINAGLTDSYVYAIAIDPTSSSIYTGTGSGVFKTNDGGGSWTRVGFEGQLALAAVVAPPNIPAGPGTVYVAVGHAPYLYKSTDGGEVWQSTGLNDSVLTLAVDPTSPDVIHAGGTSGVFTSYTGGGTWNHVPIEDVHVLVVDPANPSVIYAGAFQGVFKSLDQGTSWNQTSLSGSRVPALGMALAPTPDGGAAFALYAGVSDERGVLVSFDGGADWMSTGLNVPVSAFAAGPAHSFIYAGAFTGSDAFVTKLSPSGNDIVYSTLLGGSGWESSHGIAIGGDGSAYITGVTDSSDFPTARAVQELRGGSQDIFVTKLDRDGGLGYSTYLGGTDHEDAPAIAVDAAGRAYVAGHTLSDDFPTTLNPLQSTREGSSDLFVTVLAPEGGVAYSTYFGGSLQDSEPAIAVDGSGVAYLTGTTYSRNLPVLGAFQPSHAGGYSDAFVAALNGAGSLVYSTYLGGRGGDAGQAIAATPDGTVYVTGSTSSDDFPTRNPLMSSLSGGSDAFVAALVEGEPDLIAPTSSIVPHGTPGDNGWFRSEVTVEIAAADNTAGSGVASIEFSVNGSSFQPYLAPFTISTDGNTEVRARATDNAHNVETPPVTVLVGIDRASPLLNVIAPRAENHLHSEPLSIDFTASDTVSGLVPGSLTATLDSTAVAHGQTIAPLSLSLGDHTFVFAASDAAGNHSQQQIVFQVIATLDSLKAAVSLLTQAGQIEQKLTGSLMSKLDDASRAEARGNRTVARNKLTEFINQVQAQSGKSIAPSAAQILIGDGNHVLAAL